MDTKTKHKGTENLISLADRTPEERSEIARRAQAKSAIARKENRQVKELLHDLLYSDFSGDDNTKQLLANKGVATNEVNGLLVNMMKRANRSSTMAELLFKLHGDLQDGTNVQVNVINQMSDDQIQQELDRLGGGDTCINITPEPPKIE